MKIPNMNAPLAGVPSDVMIPVITTKSKLWLKPTDQMDTWLDAQGFYRKHIARDASSLFRCVSEQVFLTQVHHLTVRKHCIQFALNQQEIFKQLTDMPVKDYVDRLYNQREWGNSLDMEIISRMYHVDFAMYREIKKPIEQITSNGNRSFIMLSLSYEHHYDSVYPKQHIINAAICQSILYEMLYKKVFKLEEVDYAVNKMLHDKTARYQTDLNAAVFTTGFQMRLEMRDNCRNVKDLLNYGITPFPYKVAKSLDPNIYRNVEYDTWNEQRKGNRHGTIIWNNQELRVGARCLVNFKGENENIKRYGYIQDMSPNKGPVEVYIEELVEKVTVPYECLELIPNSTSDNNQTDNVIDVLSSMSLKTNTLEKIESEETKSYSILEKDIEHPRKMEDFYQPNIVTPSVHYVHSTSSTVPTTCYACITSHSFPPERETKTILHRNSSDERIKYAMNPQNTNEPSNSTEPHLLPPMQQYPVSLYPLVPQDVDVPPPVYSGNVSPPKVFSNMNETNEMTNPIRVFYNNNVDYYRYGMPTVPYYVVSPTNYIFPLNNETQGPQSTDYQRIQYSPPATQHHNDMVYAMPINTLPNTKTEVPLYPPMMTYSALPSVKKPPPRNSGPGDVTNSTESSAYRIPKDMVYMKEAPPLNQNINVPQPNPIPTNIYPYYNNSYSSISPPLYYHTYDYNSSCYPSCPELPPFSENISPPTYQVPHIVPLAYPEELYAPNGQIICQPVLPASHN